MVEFFINFMKSDQLGQIAVQHRVLADIRPRGTHDPDCILLAELHSTAVDFSKTGIPVDMRKCPRRPKYRPDFEAPGPQVVIEKDMGAVFWTLFCLTMTIRMMKMTFLIPATTKVRRLLAFYTVLSMRKSSMTPSRNAKQMSPVTQA